MTQHDGILEDQPGASFLTDLGNFAAAVLSTSKGPSRPPTPYAGQLWIDDNTPSSTVWSLFAYTGSADIKLGELNTTSNLYTPFVSGASVLASPAFTGTPTAPTA